MKSTPSRSAAGRAVAPAPGARRWRLGGDAPPGRCGARRAWLRSTDQWVLWCIDGYGFIYVSYTYVFYTYIYILHIPTIDIWKLQFMAYM